jgi:hypothetical protein
LGGFSGRCFTPCGQLVLGLYEGSLQCGYLLVFMVEMIEINSKMPMRDFSGIVS